MMIQRELMKYQQLLLGCRLFQGMKAEEWWPALEAMHARLERFEKGQTISLPGERPRLASIVLEGLVMVDYNDVEGDKTNLDVMRPGELVNLASVLSSYTCPGPRIWANADCVMLMLDVVSLRALSDVRPDLRRLYDNLVLCLADRCVELYQRGRIYGNKRIRGRVRLFLLSLPRRGNTVTLPMSRTALAAYLGVDRTALSRELSRMQEDGLISLERRRVYLMNSDFFS